MCKEFLPVQQFASELTAFVISFLPELPGSIKRELAPEKKDRRLLSVA